MESRPYSETEGRLDGTSRCVFACIFAIKILYRGKPLSYKGIRIIGKREECEHLKKAAPAGVLPHETPISLSLLDSPTQHSNV